jgi:hypothetical protein
MMAQVGLPKHSASTTASLSDARMTVALWVT